MENNGNYDYEAEFLKEFEKELKKNKKPVILICGSTGSGKTSIIQAIFGDIVPTDKIGHGESSTDDYEKYENDFIRVWDSKGLEADKGVDEFIGRTKEFIKKKQNESSSIDDHIHVFWYVIQGPGARVTDSDLKIIAEFPSESTIVLISKNDITKPVQFDAMQQKIINNNICSISANRILPVSADNYNEKISENGIGKLMELTTSIISNAYKAAFDESQRIDIERCVKAIKEKGPSAAGIIVAATTAAGAAGAIPIPVADVAIITPVQLGMIASLAALYKLDKEVIQNAVLPLIAAIAGRQAVAGLVKFIPIAGNVIAAGVAVTFTSAMGWFLQAQFENIALAKAKDEPLPALVVALSVFEEFFKNFKKDNK